MATSWRHVGELLIAQYTLEIETPAGLRLAGDAETLTGAESFLLPARLERDGSRRDSTPRSDVLSAVANLYAGDPELPASLHTLFGAKTQRFPYHVVLVALGLLVENSLPTAAVVHGDILLRDGEQARRGLMSILGEEFELPVVLSAERIQRRLMGRMTASARDKALRALGPPDPHREAVSVDLLWRFRTCSRVHYELEHVVLTCRDPNHLDPATQRLLRTILDATRSDVARSELRRKLGAWGATRARDALAQMIQKHALCLTSMAWDAIESADLDELVFLHGVLRAHSFNWDIHQAVRALLENPVLRRL